VRSAAPEWLARELGPVSLGMHRGIKDVFDPLGIFNPGKIF
jgi:glycolate oxidase